VPDYAGLQVVGTTTSLAGAGNFTSSKFNLGRAQYITGYVFADVSGTLYVEQTQDETNYDIQSSFTIAAGVVTPFRVSCIALYGRLRYINDAGAQGAFRLYANLR
jgi:hypothetical protein